MLKLNAAGVQSKAFSAARLRQKRLRINAFSLARSGLSRRSSLGERRRMRLLVDLAQVVDAHLGVNLGG